MALVHPPLSQQEHRVEHFAQGMSTDQQTLSIHTEPTTSDNSLVMHETPRRRTRSQTGTTVKRRSPEESQASSSQKTAAPRKKPRAASKKSTSSTDSEPKEGSRTESPMTDIRDFSQATTPSSSPFSTTPPLTFLESSSSPGYAPERRGPRSRATLPVPVPNLTKKSRGRRVPTQEAVEVADPKEKEKRMYVCTVEGCGKCFHRGEHLKRHIRSIHTHEKPFKCTHPSCGKFFNRHDNLLQHLKVHKQNHCEDNANPHPRFHASPTSLSPSPEPEPLIEQEPGSYISESEIESSIPIILPLKTTFPITPVAFEPFVTAAHFNVSCEPFNTNMAVSSLRTELPPNSPQNSRIRDPLQVVSRGL